MKEQIEMYLRQLAPHQNDRKGPKLLRGAVEEIDRMRKCERQLAAVTVWLEQNQKDVFVRGLWDAINNA